MWQKQKRPRDGKINNITSSMGSNLRNRQNRLIRESELRTVQLREIEQTRMMTLCGWGTNTTYATEKEHNSLIPTLARLCGS